jgi:hypothetical protein
MTNRLVELGESADPHLGGRESVHPEDEARALGVGVCVEAKLADHAGVGEDRLEDDAGGNLRCSIEGLRNLSRVGGDLAKRFFAVEVLAAGDKPNFDGGGEGVAHGLRSYVSEFRADCRGELYLDILS